MFFLSLALTFSVGAIQLVRFRWEKLWSLGSADVTDRVLDRSLPRRSAEIRRTIPGMARQISVLFGVGRHPLKLLILGPAYLTSSKTRLQLCCATEELREITRFSGSSTLSCISLLRRFTGVKLAKLDTHYWVSCTPNIAVSIIWTMTPGHRELPGTPRGTANCASSVPLCGHPERPRATERGSI